MSGKDKREATHFFRDSQTHMFEKSVEESANAPVECLGETYPNATARREHFLVLLAEKLKDPEFRKTSGFPKASDEDILRLSDPPYFTACPNPFLTEFVEHVGTPFESGDEYHREPFAVDVSIGKYDPLYRAHAYHTKVPHLAIVPSILHYTDPGDIVLDAFCGSGMTGVAAQWCTAAPLAYRSELETQWRETGHPKPEWGARRVILGDLGPAAAFIAANYNTPFEVEVFTECAERLLEEVEAEFGWMYETVHTEGGRGGISYTVWSEVFSCPQCTGDVISVTDTLDAKTKRVQKEFPCPNCGVSLNKKMVDRQYETRFDSVLKETLRVPKRRPVLVNYSHGGKQFERPLESADWAVLKQIEAIPLPPEVPTDPLPYLHRTHERARMDQEGVTHLHHFFLPRSAHVMAALWRRAGDMPDTRIRNMLLFFVDQVIWPCTILNRYRPASSFGNGPMKGVFYVSSQIAEASVIDLARGALKRVLRGIKRAGPPPHPIQVTTGDCAALPLPAQSIDYVFTDPPFGENLYYSDLNLLVESWYRVLTDHEPEAIMDRNKERTKTLVDYQRLMLGAFREYFRVLKPGRWMTVVFSNNSNAVWRAIQEGLGVAGFVVADVRTLDKKQGTFNQVAGFTVKQDLVISAYKPTQALTNQFALGAASTDSVWSFVREHLRNVPVFIGRAGADVEVMLERTAQVLNDRVIAYFVQRGIAVPITAPDFFMGLAAKFLERDGMYFLVDQVEEYDRRRARAGEVRQLDLFVTDEASAVQWVRQQLQGKPQSFQDLQPKFMQQLQSWAKHELTIELKEIFNLYLFHYEGEGPVPSQIHSYLSTNFKTLRNLDKDDPDLRAKAADRWYVPDPKKEGDLEKLRLRTLLREFEDYRTTTNRKIKQFRTEAVRAGFKHCYDEQDYQTIADVAAKLPEKIIQEDEKLLMYYDVATMRLGEDE